MDTINESAITIQPLNPGWYSGRVAGIDMLRLDELHPIISGNKWYKLKLNIKYAEEQGFKTIVTFGGGYSNHLAATSYACKLHNINSVAIIRGNYPVLTPTLKRCVEDGMKLIFVTKEDYDRQGEPEWEQQLVKDFDKTFIIPEGGANEWGRKGVELISYYIKNTYTHVCVSVGSGTTLIGLRNALPQLQSVLGYVPMKGGSYLRPHIEEHLNGDKKGHFSLFDDYHFGGFAKCNQSLIDFMNDFYQQNQVPLDRVYTAKMMSGISSQLEHGFYPEYSKILAIHTGGLQGNEAIQDQLVW